MEIEEYRDFDPLGDDALRACEPRPIALISAVLAIDRCLDRSAASTSGADGSRVGGGSSRGAQRLSFAPLAGNSSWSSSCADPHTGARNRAPPILSGRLQVRCPAPVPPCLPR